MPTIVNGITIQDQADSTLTGSTTTPAGTSALDITRIGSYATGSGAESAEVFAYDKATKQLFVMNNVTDKVEIVNFADPTAPVKVGEIDLSTIPNYGGMNSVAVSNGVLAVAVQNSTVSDPGVVALYSTAGALLNTVTVGALPDMLTFTADGKKLLVANEGENGAIESAGSVSLISLASGAASATVQTTGFDILNGSETDLRAAGIRLFAGLDASITIEPEYISISPDGKKAYVTLQENNAVATFDITGTTAVLQSVLPLGYVDFNLPGNESDFSDRDGAGSGGSSQGAISIDNDPIRGMLMPDAIASWTLGGVTYFATANEGDSRADGSDESRLSSVDLDDALFPNEALLKTEDEAGRLTISNIDGNTDGDAQLEAVYSFGGRGFSIFQNNADGTITKVFESGGEFEDIIAALPNALTVFNGQNGAEFDSRSDNKAAEPEGIEIANVGGKFYAFVTLERAGGVMVYDVTDPSNASFVDYVEPTAADFAPEIVDYIKPVDSPNGKGLLLTANEVSGTVTVYEVEPETFTLQLLHLSDGEAGLLASTTAPNLAAILDAFDDDFANTLILSGGDNFLPGPFLAAGTDPSVIATLNAVTGSTIAASATVPIGAVDTAIHNVLGVEASTIGNHEFDLGSNAFAASFTPSGGWVGATFPYMSSNLDFSGDSALNPRFTNTLDGSAATLVPDAGTLKGRIAPATVVEKGGEKIGLVAVTTQILESISSPSGTEVEGFPTGPGPNGEIDDMDMLAAQIQPIVDELIAEGINKIILMAHLQVIANEQLLATKLRGVDIILSAGSNTRLGDADDEAVDFPGHAANFAGDYPLQVTDADGKTTLIVNTDNEYTYLGRLVVDFDQNGDIILDSVTDNQAINGAYASTEENVAEAWGVDVEDLDTTAFAEGTKGDKVRDLTEAVQDVIEVKDGNVFGYTDVYLEGERVFVRSQETNLGNLSADANGFAAKQALGSGGAFVVSLKNGGGIRAQIGTISAPDPVDGSVDKLPPPANADVGKEEGGVSQLDIENSLRFNNRLMVFDTTAQGLLNILNHGVAAGTGQGRFPQIGGVKFSWDPDLPAGQRILNIALIDENDNVIARVVENGVVLPEAPSLISVVTLNFTANGGDGYPTKVNGENFRYLLDDGTLSAPIEETLDFTASANVPANALGEQQAFGEYMQAFHGTQEAAFNEADTGAALDERIENLNFRDDVVFNSAAIDGTNAGEIIDGTIGNDTINAKLGNDRVFGGEGGDTVLGGVGNDSLFGEAGNDSLLGGEGNDRLFGDEGNDTLVAGVGNDTVHGDEGDDSLVAGEGNDQLLGGEGNDTMNGGAGADAMLGSSGDDFYYVDNAGDGVLELANEGTDTVRAYVDYALTANVERLVMLGTAVQGSGNDLGNSITGNASNNLLSGLGGSDTINGGEGNDTLNGGDSNDTLLGGGGTDKLDGGAGGDRLYGQGGDDDLNGGDGDDTITGGDGNDVLTGGAGTDILNGEVGDDVYVFNAGFGKDTIQLLEAGDRIEIKGFGFTSSQEVLDSFKQIGAHAVLNLGGDKLTVLNTQVSSLTNAQIAISAPSSSQSPFIVGTDQDVSFTSLLTTGDQIGLKDDGVTPWRMVGIPDGLGAFDNGDGTFTVLMNHELPPTQGVARDHGATGAFVAKLVIDKATLQVLSGEDLVQHVFLYDTATDSFFDPLTDGNPATLAYQFSRLCSADLPEISAFFNADTGKGYNGHIFMNGEETGAEGKGFAHFIDGAEAGNSYELPWLGKFSWENSIANPNSGDKTVVAGTDDATPGQVYFYVGNKQSTGSALDKAGLTNGHLFGLKVDELDNGTDNNNETNGTTLGGDFESTFSLVDLGDVSETTGANLQTQSEAAEVTEFLRPEDGVWDSTNEDRFYFVTTNGIESPSRLWAMDFIDGDNPELGGTIRMLLDGTEGQKMFDNMTVSDDGKLILQEDVGNNARLGKIWEYDPTSDTLSELAEHDATRFLNGSARFLTQDEEASGAIDVTDILGDGTNSVFLMDVQSHNNLGGELVQGGQLLLMYQQHDLLV
jgi:2',3'-cyclic-nucleotide 2'-phosphodiesterase (5'-nucleotidase family)